MYNVLYIIKVCLCTRRRWLSLAFQIDLFVGKRTILLKLFLTGKERKKANLFFEGRHRKVCCLRQFNWHAKVNWKKFNKLFRGVVGGVDVGLWWSGRGGSDVPNSKVI